MFKTTIISLLCFLVIACSPKTTAQTTNSSTTQTTTPTTTNDTKTENSNTNTSSSVISTTLPLDKSVRYGVLPNGMTYYIKQNKKPENRVELRLAVNAGSNQEEDNQQGLAHFLEHMAFNGSKHFAKNDLVNFLEGLGVKFGAHLNAYTSFDETVYMLQLPTDKKEALDKGFLILEDWANGLSFDSTEIEKERGVVLSEWRSGQGPDMRLLYKFLPTMYYQSRYAERLPIGDTSVLKNCPHERVTSFYKDWYRPDLMAIMIVGDINVDSMEQEVKTRFADLKNPSNEKPKIEYELPKHEKTLVSIATDPEATSTKAYIIYKHNKINTSNIQGFALSTANALINSMFNSRLSELAQKNDAPFIQAATSYAEETRKNDALSSYVFIKSGKAKEALNSILEENNRVKQFGFVASELGRAKLELIKSYEDAVKEKDKTESRSIIGEYVSHFLNHTPAMDIETEAEYANQIISSINLETINSLAKNYISKENRVIVLTAPSSELALLPSENEILSLVNKTDDETLTPYEDNTINEPLIDFNINAGTISKTFYDEPTNITTYVLSNGATVKYKPTDFKNDEIYFSAYSNGGTSLYSNDQFMSVDYSNAIVDASGIYKFDMPTLTKLLTGKSVSISPYIGELDEGFDGSTTKDDLETLMQLLYLYHTLPRKSDNDFNTFMQKQHAIYDNLYSNPQYYFYKKVAEINYKNNIRKNMPTKETLDKINLDSAYLYYNQRFNNAADFTYYFVGNIDKTKFDSLVCKYIASLPADMSVKEYWRDNYIEKPKGKITSNTEMGNTPKTFVNINKHGDMIYTDEEALKFNAMVKVLNILLRESLREDKGGVYGVSVQSSATKYPSEKYAVNIGFNADPPKAQELIAAVNDVIDDFIANGTTQERLNKVKETFKREYETNLKENSFWIAKMVYADKYAWDIHNLDKYISAVDALDLKTIQETAEQYLSTENTIQVTLEPKKE